MKPGTVDPQWVALDEIIEAYESTQARTGAADLTQFLPPTDHPLYVDVLRELVRVDLEYSWKRGRPCTLQDYQRRFPEFFADAKALGEIAFEEYRLRQQAGATVTPEEYQRLGVSTQHWPSPDAADGKPGVENPNGDDWSGQMRDLPGRGTLPLPTSAGAREAASAYREYPLRHQEADAESFATWCQSFDLGSESARFLQEIHESDPQTAYGLTQAVKTMPAVGADFAGFRLVAELGHGAFGRVYLARQGELANRFVALKISPHLWGESQTLAQLQHTNIVPIFSIHRVGLFQAVCMPYFGTTTLADLTKELAVGARLPDSGRFLPDTICKRRAALALSLREAGALLQPESSIATFRLLESQDYVGAVLWLAVHLVDGLAHAQERNIVHRDLKPANILLTDEGRPMLLDFNLSQDTKVPTRAAKAWIGGTLPYMAPEQLEAFLADRAAGDARADLYALGVILYELLTGRHPFPRERGMLKSVLTNMLAQRRQLRPELRRWNPKVTPAVESIVQRLLAVDPDKRYQTALELRDDLQRHLDNYPLKHAPDPSFNERLNKWRRRHPRLVSATSVGVVAGVLILALSGVLVGHWNQQSRLEAAMAFQQTRLEAVNAFQQTRDDLPKIESLLNRPDSELQQRDDGMALCRQAVERYGVLASPPWQESQLVGLLSGEDQARLREHVGEILVFWAWELRWRVAAETDPAKKEEQLELALLLNERAQDCFATDLRPSGLWAQRAQLASLAGREEEAEACLEKAKRFSLRSPRHSFLLLSDHLDFQQLSESLPFVRAAIQQDPTNYAVWFMLGNCHVRLGQMTKAIGCYDLGINLCPDAAWAYFNRGTMHLEQKDFAQALDDFEQVVRLRPDIRKAYFNRGLAHFGLDLYPEAIQDFSHYLEQGGLATRTYFVRARVHTKMGNRKGAQQDYEEGLRREPTDEEDCIARGVANINRDPRAALADFEKALRINPHSQFGLQNRAHLLAENFNQTAEAIQLLDKVLGLYPYNVFARAGRGVYHARLGNRSAAHADAKEALRGESPPAIVYQVAGIYALTSRQHPEDRSEAFRLLSSALGRGFGFDLLEKDTDLEPIRKDDEYRRLVEAARLLQASRSARAR